MTVNTVFVLLESIKSSNHWRVTKEARVISKNLAWLCGCYSVTNKQKQQLGFQFMNLYCLQKIPSIHGYPLWILEMKVGTVFPTIVTHLWKIITAAFHSQYSAFAEWEFSTNCCPPMFPVFLSVGYWSSVCLRSTPFSF